MSMGYVRCPYCSASAEKLYAVDRQIECFCPECYADWTMDMEVAQPTYYEKFNEKIYGEG
ncbi:MAG: hypothetical protein CL599_19265 [Alteromonas sp.]|nr:hypothetical protein [Alteromonas sp.]|tara:strand:- start:33023 stop:33202 length:180 start_codon:yes stop_codon:yes gene_type:complete